MPSKFINNRPKTNSDSSIGILQLCSGQDAQNRCFYAYVSIDPDKYADYLRLSLSSENFNLLDFGEVIHTDFGANPSERIQKEMTEKYGIDHTIFLDENILKTLSGEMA